MGKQIKSVKSKNIKNIPSPVEPEIIEPENKIDRIVKRVLEHRRVKFNQEKHVKLLVTLFSVGKDVASFCSEAEIDRSTFYDWLDNNYEFNITYSIAKQLSMEWWIQYGEENAGKPYFNQKWYSLLMRNRFGEETDHRKLKIPGLKTAKNLKEKIEIIMENVSGGQLTGQEASQLASLVLASLKVEEHTDVVNRLEAIEDKMK